MTHTDNTIFKTVFLEVVLFFLLFFTVVIIIGFRTVFVRQKGPTLWNEPPEATEQHALVSEEACKIKHRVIHILSRDRLKLYAKYFPAHHPTRNTVILVHGYRGNGLHDHAHNVLYYHKAGYNVLLPDHRAHGESEGRYISFGVLESEDVELWCKHVVNELDADKILLHGVSMGAATVLLDTSRSIVGLCGAVSDCSYTSGSEIIRYVSRKIFKLPFFIVLKALLLAARMVCKADIKGISPIKAVKNARVPILFIHGTRDNFVPTEMSKRLYDACASKKRLLLFREAHHAESCKTAPKKYYDEISAFMAELGM